MEEIMRRFGERNESSCLDSGYVEEAEGWRTGRRNRGDRGKMESLLQAGPSVDWVRNEECSSLRDSTIVACTVARSLNGFPSGLSGGIWLGLSLRVLQLL